MAKPPCARLTKPIRPIVTERPTDTMNKTMPAATPPSSMLATSTPKITTAERLLGRCRARTDLLLLAGVLDPVDLADHLLVDTPVLHDRFGQVLVHDDVAGHRIDHDRTARAP